MKKKPFFKVKFPRNKNLILCENFKNYLSIIKMSAWTSVNRNIIMIKMKTDDNWSA